MTPAKPQQMSGQNDPDDLIAELTKLMATDIKAAAEPPRAVPTDPAPGPAQTIRIPGVSQPVAAGSGTPAGKFDFGTAPKTSSLPPPEPLANWQDRLGGGKPLPTGGGNSPAPAGSAGSARQEPSVGASNWRPAIAPGEAERDTATSGPAFEFDFGFNRQRPEPPRPVPAPDAVPSARPATASPVAVQPTPATNQPPAHDPIADLIAAELDATMNGRPTEVAASGQQVVEEVEEQLPTQYVPPAPPALRNVNFTPSPAPQRAASPEYAPVPARPSNQVARQPVENDRFSTAPVFGLGNRPAGEPVTPRVELDPMDEIENLIGEAVRVELNAPPPPSVRMHEEPRQPAVPPLTTNFAPRRTSLREPEAGSIGADEAILAAAAATGAEVGRIDSPFAEERAIKPKKQTRRERPARVERRSGGAMRTLVVPAIAGCVLLALGFGLYWALGMGHHDGKAPVLTADAQPAKTIPDKPADTKPHSVVMDELGGNTPASTTETLVSRDQTAGANAVGAPAAATTASNDDAGLANRKVRTVTVRPDGTIVTSDDSVAGAAQLPVSRPNVPAVPGVSVASAASGAAAPAPAAAGAVADATPAADAAPAADTTPASDVASADNAVAGTPDPSAPVPMARSLRPQSVATADEVTPASPEATSSSRPTSAVNALVRGGSGAQKPIDLIGDLAAASETPAPAQPRANARPAPQVATAESTDSAAAAAANSVAHVQLSSQQSAAGAQASASSLEKRFGNLFNGVKPQVVKADLGAKGVYYRVVIPTGSLSDAQQLCSTIKSNGGDCMAANG